MFLQKEVPATAWENFLTSLNPQNLLHQITLLRFDLENIDRKPVVLPPPVEIKREPDRVVPIQGVQIRDYPEQAFH